MVRRLLVCGAMLLACSGTAFAQDAVIGGNIGGFLVQERGVPRPDDVLRNNRTFLVFDLDEFNGATFGGDFAVSVGSFVEVGAGLNYYQRTVPSSTTSSWTRTAPRSSWR